MATNYMTPPQTGYYRCGRRYRLGKYACSQGKNFRAEETERRVWEAVAGLLGDPEQLRADLEQMIELERDAAALGDPKWEEKVWLDKLAEADRKRCAYQDQQAEALITIEELRTKLAVLEETRKTAQRELEALRGRKQHIEELERDKDALLESYAGIALEVLDSLAAEERRRIYGMLGVRVVARPDKTLELSGRFMGGMSVCESERTSS